MYKLYVQYYYSCEQFYLFVIKNKTSLLKFSVYAKNCIIYKNINNTPKLQR